MWSGHWGHFKSYQALHHFPKLIYKINPQTASIELTIPVNLLETRFENVYPVKQFVVPQLSKLGGFFNYDLLDQTSSLPGKIVPKSAQFSGVLTPGLFNQWGSGTSAFLERYSGSQNTVTRLNTTWEKDNPFTMRTLRLGDSYSTPGTWGRSVGFGGIQFATNFATQPAFITFPLPSAAGEAVVPTAVDVFVNDALIEQRTFPAGPFTLHAIPVVSGGGTINMVTTDILGREQVTSIPYYTAKALLKPGLKDYSVETGFIRNNFGLKSNDYGRWLLVGNYRQGITDAFTAEGHAEMVSNQQTVGASGSFLLSTYGILTLSAAGSYSSQLNSTGALAQFGFQHMVYKGINYGFSATLTTSQFKQVGFDQKIAPPKLLGQLFIGLTLPYGASMGFTYINERNRGTPNVSLLSVGYNQNIAKTWFLNATAQMNIEQRYGKALFITLTRALGARTSVNFNTSVEQDNSQGNMQLIQNLPAGTGWGYNLSAGAGKNANYLASVSAQSKIGTYIASSAYQHQITGYQLQANGSVAAVGGQAYLTRLLQDSFAVVQVPGLPNVRVYSENQLIGRTDRHGNIFIPRLLAYQHNALRIDPTDVPLSAEMNVDQLDAIPYRRSGLVVRFPVKSYNAIVATLVRSTGEKVPPGAVVRFVGQEQPFIVANEGRVYITNLVDGKNQFHVEWDQQVCYFALNYHTTNNPLPRFGTITCK